MNTDKTRRALESAAARIGCPPGDNADADIYREILHAIDELDKAKVLTDEEISRMSVEYALRVLQYAQDTRSPDDPRTVHESFIISAYKDAMKYTRDNYLIAPSAGYHMSRDYEALYRLLCDGGEALGFASKMGHNGKPSRVPVNPRKGRGGIGFVAADWTNGVYIDKSLFIAECQRLNLEWVAPGNGLSIDEVMGIVEPLCLGDATARAIRSSLESAAKAKQP